MHIHTHTLIAHIDTHAHTQTTWNISRCWALFHDMNKGPKYWTLLNGHTITQSTIYLGSSLTQVETLKMLTDTG